MHGHSNRRRWRLSRTPFGMLGTYNHERKCIFRRDLRYVGVCVCVCVCVVCVEERDMVSQKP